MTGFTGDATLLSCSPGLSLRSTIKMSACRLQLYAPAPPLVIHPRTISCARIVQSTNVSFSSKLRTPFRRDIDILCSTVAPVILFSRCLVALAPIPSLERTNSPIIHCVLAFTVLSPMRSPRDNTSRKKPPLSASFSLAHPASFSNNEFWMLVKIVASAHVQPRFPQCYWVMDRMFIRSFFSICDLPVPVQRWPPLSG